MSTPSIALGKPPLASAPLGLGPSLSQALSRSRSVSPSWIVSKPSSESVAKITRCVQTALLELNLPDDQDSATTSKLQELFASEALSDQREAAIVGAYALAKRGEWQRLDPIADDLNTLTNTCGQTLLMIAVSEGDKAAARGLVERGISAFSKTAQGTSALHVAAKKGDAEMMRVVQDTAGNVDKTDIFIRTPLHIAVYYNNVEAVQYLVQDLAAKLDSPAPYAPGLWDEGSTTTEASLEASPVTLAVLLGHTECFDTMMQRIDVRTELTSSDIGNLCHVAVHFRQTAMLEHLLKNYSELAQSYLKREDAKGLTPAGVAAATGDIDSLEVIYHYAPKTILAKDRCGRTPVHWAAEGLHTAVLEFYGKHIPPQIACFEELSTSIGGLKAKSPIAILQDLLEKAPYNFKARQAEAAGQRIMRQHKLGKLQSAEVLSKNPTIFSTNERRVPMAAPHKPTQRPPSPLVMNFPSVPTTTPQATLSPPLFNTFQITEAQGPAVEKLRMIAQQCFKSFGKTAAEIEACPEGVLSTMCYNALYDRVKTAGGVKVFTEGAHRAYQQDLENLRDISGRNVMLRAVEEGDVARVKHMAANFFGVMAEDSTGRCSLSIAAEHGHTGMVRALQETASIDHPDAKGKTPLHEAVGGGHLATVKALCRFGANIRSAATITVNNVDIKLTPLAYAVIQGHEECVDFLMAHQDRDLSVEGYGNILHLAARFNQSEMLRYLLQQHGDICLPLITKSEKGLTPTLAAVEGGALDALRVFAELGLGLETTTRDKLTALHIAAEMLDQHMIRLLAYYRPGLLNESAIIKGKDTELNPSGYASFLKEKTEDQRYFPITKLLESLRKQAQRNELSPPNFVSSRLINLVLRGGGPAGIAYAGVYRYLSTMGINDNEELVPLVGPNGEPALKEDGTAVSSLIEGVERIGGTSAGAIGAAFIGLGFTHEQVGKLLSTDILSFLDPTEQGGEFLKDLGKESIDQALKEWEDTLFAVVKETAKGGMRRSWKGAASKLFKFQPRAAAAKLGKGIKQTVEGFPTGICKGDKFENWMEAQIAQHTGIDNMTFGELKAKIARGEKAPPLGLSHAEFKARSEQGEEFPEGLNYKHIHVYTTCLHKDGKISIERLTSETNIYNPGESWWDDVIISSAIRASMSIPVAFVPHTLKAKVDGVPQPLSHRGRFLDGGMLMNFPIEAFDARRFQTQRPMAKAGAEEQHIMNRHTLGIALHNPEPTEATGTSASPAGKVMASGGEFTTLDLARRVIKVYTGAEDHIRDTRKWNEYRTVKVDRLGVKMLDFGLDADTKGKLDDSGFNGMGSFFGSRA